MRFHRREQHSRAATGSARAAMTGRVIGKADSTPPRSGTRARSERVPALRGRKARARSPSHARALRCSSRPSPHSPRTHPARGLAARPARARLRAVRRRAGQGRRRGGPSHASARCSRISASPRRTSSASRRLGQDGRPRPSRQSATARPADRCGARSRLSPRCCPRGGERRGGPGPQHPRARQRRPKANAASARAGPARSLADSRCAAWRTRRQHAKPPHRGEPARGRGHAGPATRRGQSSRRDVEHRARDGLEDRVPRSRPTCSRHSCGSAARDRVLERAAARTCEVPKKLSSHKWVLPTRTPITPPRSRRRSHTTASPSNHTTSRSSARCAPSATRAAGGPAASGPRRTTRL
jgi:hypothetical protein